MAQFAVKVVREVSKSLWCEVTAEDIETARRVAVAKSESLDIEAYQWSVESDTITYTQTVLVYPK